jgi:hypothetical protein
MDAFVFFSETHIVAALTREDEDGLVDETCLVLVDFSSLDGSAMSMDDIHPCLLLMLPVLANNAHFVDVSIRSDPTPGWSPSEELDVPFHISKYDRLFVVTMYIVSRNGGHALSLYVPRNTFDSMLERARAENEWVMPWDIWGRDGTRMLKHARLPSPVWECFVFGSKAVSSHTGSNATGKISAEIYDFNPAKIKHHQALCRESGASFEMSGISLETVTAPSVFNDPMLFRQPVETYLPFRRGTMVLEEDEAQACEVMCYEDGLVIINVCSFHLHVRMTCLMCPRRRTWPLSVC